MRSYRLEAFNGSGALVFSWDAMTGKLEGPDADQVQAIADVAKRNGYAMGHPHPTPYKISDPLRNAGELAVLLGTLWRLTPDLAAAYPRPPADDLPPGAIA